MSTTFPSTAVMRLLIAIVVLFLPSCAYLFPLMHIVQLRRRTKLTSSSVAIADDYTPNPVGADAVVVGSGPAGLAAALMLAKQPNIDKIRVFDALPEPPRSDDMNVWGNFQRPRSYNVGLSGRGQQVLKALDCLPRVLNASIALTLSQTWSPSDPHSPSTRDLRRGRSYRTVCLERDRLAACLLEALREDHGDKVTVDFDSRCVGVDFLESGRAEEKCRVRISSSVCGEDGVGDILVETPFLVGADGANSAVRDAMQAHNPKLRVQKFEDTNIRVYRTIALHAPPNISDQRSNWGDSFSYSARSSVGINLEALPTKEGVHLGVILYRPGDPIIGNITNAQQAREFFQKHFPDFVPLIKQTDFEHFASKGDSKFPKFQYAGPELHCDSSAVLVGDSIHTVKPYFGLGVNSAFEDVGYLRKMLQSHADRATSLRMYSDTRAQEAKTLVTLSQNFDRSIIRFVLPLVVDNFFHRMLPAVFERTTLAMLQDERLSFKYVARRKILDRVMQLGVMGATAALLRLLLQSAWSLRRSFMSAPFCRLV